MFDQLDGRDAGDLDLPADPQWLAGAADEELLDAALRLERARRRLDAASTALLAEIDVRGATEVAEGMRTPRWLAHHAELPAATAAARVRAARALRLELAEVGELLAAGRIGLDHARVLADACNPRIADRFGPVARVLAEEAPGVVFEVWARQVRAAAALLDADGGHDPSADARRNRLRKCSTIDETHLLQAQLVGSDGLLVHQTIDRVADELFRRAAAEQELSPTELRVPARIQLEAMALVEICRRAMGVALASTAAPATDVTLVVNAGEPDTAHDPSGIRLQDGSTRHLTCDGRLLPVVVDALGVPLDLGRAVRLARPSQRRAMALRDGGCVFPGCTSPPSWCDAHHLDPWGRHGRTDVARMASLCRHHHMVVHRSGWSTHARPDGTFWFETDAGRRFWGQQHGRQVRGPLPDPPGADDGADCAGSVVVTRARGAPPRPDP